MGRILGWMNKANRNLRRESITKSLPYGTRIGLPTKIPKAVAMYLRGLGVLHVGNNTWVSVLPVHGFFGCGDKGHQILYCPNHKEKGKAIKLYPLGCLDLNSPKRNHFYALGSKGKDLSRMKAPVSLISLWWICLAVDGCTLIGGFLYLFLLFRFNLQSYNLIFSVAWCFVVQLKMNFIVLLSLCIP